MVETLTPRLATLAVTRVKGVVVVAVVTVVEGKRGGGGAGFHADDGMSTPPEMDVGCEDVPGVDVATHCVWAWVEGLLRRSGVVA